MESVKILKTIINKGNLQDFKTSLLEETQQLSTSMIDTSFLFQKIYLHACLKKKVDIAEYLEKDIYPILPEIEKIAIRQCFAYGKYLLRR